MTPKTLIVAALLSAFPFFAQAAEVRAGDIAVIDPWVRWAPQGGAAGAFLTLSNGGDSDDRLVAATSVNAASVELHTSIADGNIMRMRPVDAIVVPAHGTVALKPGGFHIMVMGFKEPLRLGATLPLELNFEHAGKVQVYATIYRPGGMGPSAEGGPGMMPMGMDHKMDRK